MKRPIKAATFAILTALLLPLCGCSLLLPATERFSGNYEVAVIRTSDYTDPTYIEYYDNNLQLVGTGTYPYTCLENVYALPCVVDGVAYITHRGDKFFRNGAGIAGISTSTGEVQEYGGGGGFLGATGSFLFSSGMGIAYIAQTDIRTGEVQTYKFEEGHTYTYGTDGTGVLISYDKMVRDDCELIYFSDIAEIGAGVKAEGLGPVHFISNAIDGLFYFTAARYIVHDDETTEYDHTLNSFSPADGQIRTYLHSEHSLLHVADGGECLLVMQRDTNDAAASKILIVDKVTGELIGECALPFYPRHISVHNGCLYVLGHYKGAGGSSCLYQYRIEGTTLIHMADTVMEEGLTRDGREKGTPYFASGMFFSE
jgi:hypothetical protein